VSVQAFLQYYGSELMVCGIYKLVNLRHCPIRMSKTPKEERQTFKVLWCENSEILCGSKHCLTVTGGRTEKSQTNRMGLLQQVLNPLNMAKARERVIANKGEEGVDGMKVSLMW